MRPMRSRIREHQHMGLRQDRQADIQRQPFLRQHNRQETESHMEKINLSEAIEKLAIAHGIAREEIEAVLEYYQAQQPQDVPKFDIDDYCNRYNIEYYIDPHPRGNEGATQAPPPPLQQEKPGSDSQAQEPPAKGQHLDLEPNKKPPEHQARLPLRATASNEGEGLGGGVHTPTHRAHTHTRIQAGARISEQEPSKTTNKRTRQAK